MEGPDGIKFVLMVNKQGHTRLAKWFPGVVDDPAKRRLMEHELVRKCMPRDVNHVRAYTSRRRVKPGCTLKATFIEHDGYTIVYRRYASLFFIVGIDDSMSPLAIWEFIHRLVETLNKTFENVSELDIMVNSALANMVLDEMLGPGCIMDTNIQSTVAPLAKLPVVPTRTHKGK